MEKEQYVVEREYLGITSIKELMSAIIKNHNDSSRDEQAKCTKTVEKVRRV